MKKLLSLLMAVSLTATGVSGIVANKPYEPTINEKNKVDWNQVENYFSKNSFKNQYQNNLLKSPNTPVTNSEFINKAKEKSLEYVNDFKNKDLNLNQITKYLKTNITNFDQNFKVDNKTKGLNLGSYSLLQTNNKVLDKRRTIVNALTTIDKIKVIKIAIYTAATISEIAAAGFWAASWGFGISVPWAIAATTLGAALYTIYYGINTFLKNNNIAKKNLWDDLLWAKDITLFAASISYSLIYNTALLASQGVVTATSWAVPAVFGAVGVLFGTWAWLKLYIENII